MLYSDKTLKVLHKHHKHFIALGGGALGIVVYSVTNTTAGKTEEVTSSAIADARNAKPIPTRAEQIEGLSSGKEFDVLIVGGGATGSGAALDAQTRGLSTALIERGDFGNETSSRSTKLIWAGIKYIATATSSLLRVRNFLRPVDSVNDFVSEVQMVRGAHKERRLLLSLNPHLTNWVPIAVPVEEWVSWPAPFGHPLFSFVPMVLPAVFKLYDGMGGFSCPPSHIMGTSRALRKFPQLASEQAKYYSVFYEGQHNDSRTCTYIALTAAEKGATCCNYTEMIAVIKDSSGKATGVKVRDNISGKIFEVYAKAIIFAGGPFTDSLRKIEDEESKPAVAAAGGTHIVIPGYYCPRGFGMLDINTSDGRFLFFLPWHGKTLIGTTDRKGPPVSSPEPPEEEINWLISECQKYLEKSDHGGIKVRRSDVLSAWHGFRPLASDPNAPSGAPISRDHIISTNPETGITFITGGKWTTYREMAQDVIDRVINTQGMEERTGPCVTDSISLKGGAGFSRNSSIHLAQEYGVSINTAEHLAKTYGTYAFDVCKTSCPSSKKAPNDGEGLLLPGYPFLEREIVYACKHEMAVTVKDMLTIRTRLAYIDSVSAAKIAPRVAEIMGEALGWSKKEKRNQLNEALEVIGQFGGPIPKDGGK